MELSINRQEIINDLKHNGPELASGFCILLLSLLLLYMKRQYVITLLGAIAILVIAMEKRAQFFDRIVALLVIFFLTIGFVLIG